MVVVVSMDMYLKVKMFSSCWCRKFKKACDILDILLVKHSKYAPGDWVWDWRLYPALVKIQQASFSLHKTRFITQIICVHWVHINKELSTWVICSVSMSINDEMSLKFGKFTINFYPEWVEKVDLIWLIMLVQAENVGSAPVVLA